ncbi:hypothetical protein BVY04_03670, partial [bacterium M21]
MPILLLSFVLLMHSVPAVAEEISNAFCPVMKEERIDPSIFVKHEGKRIYFCCKFCKNSFAKNPTAYVSAPEKEKHAPSS